MSYNSKLYILCSPPIIIGFLLYLVIFHANLFYFVNIEQLKQFIPSIFIPSRRGDGLYNEAIIAGTISFISILVLPIYYFIFFMKAITPEKVYNTLKYQGKEKYIFIKAFVAFIFCFVCTIYFMFAIHDIKPSHLRIKQFITSDVQRHLFMDILCLNIMYICVTFAFFLVTSISIFNAKKKSNFINSTMGL